MIVQEIKWLELRELEGVWFKGHSESKSSGCAAVTRRLQAADSEPAADNFAFSNIQD